jgi:hypothetical protein
MPRAAATLSKKLGVKAGQQVLLLGAPERWCARFEAEAVASDVRVSRQLRSIRDSADCIVMFLDCLSDLEDRIVPVSDRLLPDGQVWVAWRSRRAADVNEGVVRRIGLVAGLVDTQVRQIDTVWSGMRLVNRRENRDALSQTARARRQRS